jgi:SET domain-containing protein
VRYLHDRVYADDQCSAGRGVRAAVDIAAGATVEICPVVVVPADQVEHLDRTALYDHYYRFGADAAVALGCGSLYNHSPAPNARYDADVTAGVIRIVAVADITAGDEVLVDYTRGGTNPRWFVPND